jgi:hypothetical protein
MQAFRSQEITTPEHCAQIGFYKGSQSGCWGGVGDMVVYFLFGSSSGELVPAVGSKKSRPQITNSPK